MKKDTPKQQSKWIHWLSRIGTTFGLAGITWLFLSKTGLLGGSFLAGLLCALTAYEFSLNSSPKIKAFLRWTFTILSFFIPYAFHRLLESTPSDSYMILCYEAYMALFLVISLLALRSSSVLRIVCESRLFPIWGIALPLTSLIFVAHFFMDHGRSSTQALLWVIMIIFVTKATDIGALIFGSAFGKHKLAPKTSPGKTIEGAIGGVALSISVGLVVFWLGDIHLNADDSAGLLLQIIKVIVAVGIISVTGILGDLFESSWKRYNEIKDSGGCLPGLGGVYDLTDSIILSAPISYFLIKYFLIS